MNKFLIGALATLGIGAATGGIVAASGIVNVAANEPHSAFVYQTLAFARERSIANRASDIKVPEDFADPERVRRGAGNYAAMCVSCHLAPEMENSEIRKGLYPTPPNLSAKAETPSAPRNAARDFWIIKNGIKASGMPAWSSGGMEDAVIWDLAAFLQKMPLMAKADYEQLVAASDGHSHGGMEGHDHAGGHEDHHAEPAQPQPVAKSKKSQSHGQGSHDHGSHKH